jgi:saccharopine dehydrogenase-like NADP-dependent oxidoreductase
MRAVVLGVGRMGTAIAWAMDKLGFQVTGMDTNPDAANNIPFKVNNADGKTPRNDFFIVGGVEDIFAGLCAQKLPDVVISSLPYHQTEEVGSWCIDNAVRYCDLGGRVDVSNNINEMAINYAKKPVMTDLGLAPGLVNILAEEGYRRLYGSGEITSVEMMVGGLPDFSESANNPLRYAVTWSVDGLINEYRDDCIVLEGGQIKTVKGMEGLEVVDSELGDFEAFYTSGGASHSILSMKERGVQNCHYKTLRYRGHRDIVRFLIRDCELSDDALNKIFITGCGHANKDEVFIISKVHKDEKAWAKEIRVKSDAQFSAMQKATAFPISSVAALMAEGTFDGKKDEHRDYYTYYTKNLSYSDIPFDKFSEKLSTLGLDL